MTEVSVNLPSPNRDIQTVSKSKRKMGNKHHLNTSIYDSYMRKDYSTCLALIKSCETFNENKRTEFHLFMLGLINRQMIHLDKSLSYFKQCLMMDKLNFEYLKEMARGFFVLGKLEAAMQAAHDACGIKKDQEIKCLMGRVQVAQGNNSEAIKYFEESLEIEPNDESYVQLARLNLNIDRKQKAHQILSQGLKYSSENSQLLDTLGDIAISLDHFEEAQSSFESSFDVNPWSGRALLGLGYLSQIRGEIDDAMSRYKTLMQISPNCAELWNNIGLCLMEKEKYLASFCCIRKAIFLDPFLWESHANLGLVCLEMKKYLLASVNFTTSLSLNPRNPKLLNLLGVSLSHISDFANAELSYQEALNVESASTVFESSPTVYINYVKLLVLKQDYPKAQSILEEAIKRFGQGIGAEKIASLRGLILER